MPSLGPAAPPVAPPVAPPAAPPVVAVDLGGTSVRSEVIDAAGNVLASSRRPTPVGDPDAAFEAVAGVIGEVLAASPQQPVAAGVAIPGLVDIARGRSIWSVNVGWRDLPVADLLADRFSLPVALEHDVTAAGLAEHELGAGRGCDDLLVVVLGTGAAAVVFAGGRLVRGGRGQAGELGHVVVRPGGRTCRCGRQGCLEAHCSARAIGLAYAEALGIEPIGSAEVAARLGSDPVADRVWADAVAALADALLSAVALLGSDRVVVGGGLAEAGDALLVPLREQVAQRATIETLPQIERAGLRARAGIVGAALVARRALAVGPPADRTEEGSP